MQDSANSSTARYSSARGGVRARSDSGDLLEWDGRRWEVLHPRKRVTVTGVKARQVEDIEVERASVARLVLERIHQLEAADQDYARFIPVQWQEAWYMVYVDSDERCWKDAWRALLAGVLR